MRATGHGGAAAAVLGVMLFAGLLVSLPGRSIAETVVRSEVDSRRVGVQDVLQFTITVEGSSLPDQVPLPALTNLRVVGGPSVSTQMSFVNGRSSQARSWTYAMQPTAVGHAEVGAVSVRGESGEVTAPAIPIAVIAGSAAPPQPARRAADPFSQDPLAQFMNRSRGPERKVMVEAKPSRTSVYVGEPVLLTYYLYTQASVSGLQFTDAPQFSGFWAEDIAQTQQPGGEPATVEGVNYRRFPVMLKLLFPTKAGRLTVPASTLEVGVAAQSFFEAGGAVRRSTAPFTLNVKPIPDEPGFSGAVGHFKASASVDHSSLAFGEAATLRFRVEGNGNLKWIDRGPELVVPGAKVYPPQVKSDLRTLPTGIVGSRTWEFVVVPQTVGALEIPSLTFSYFDPATGRIVRSTTASLPLQVTGGAPGNVAVLPPMPGSVSGSRAGVLPLRSELESAGGSGTALPGRLVGIIALVTLISHGLLWGVDRLSRLARVARGAQHSPRAARGALADLQRVGREDMTKEAAAGLIERTVHRVFGPLDGDDSERARTVRELLQHVHEVRYAPQFGDYSERLGELAARAGEVIRRWS